MDDLLSEFPGRNRTRASPFWTSSSVKLERTRTTRSAQQVFRLMHTIKGTCGFLGLPRLKAVAHAGENVLGKVRDGELEVSAETSCR